MTPLQPPGWERPRGYTHGVMARGRQIFVAGQVGWVAPETVVSTDLVDQVDQALRNVLTVLAQAGAEARHIVRMTWYLADAREYNARLNEIGRVYRAHLGRHFPAMTAIEVAGFVEEGAKVEIEVTAVLPDESPAAGGQGM